MPHLSAPPTLDSAPADISCQLGEHQAHLSLNGPLTVVAIQRLVQQVKLAFSYYQYERVELEIDSIGGDLRALNYFLEHRQAWREQGYAVHTCGAVTCASAAALLVAFGDLGKRHIYRSTQLLFHFSRVLIENRYLTARDTRELTRTLQQTDEAMLGSLIEYISYDSHAVMAERLTWVKENMALTDVNLSLNEIQYAEWINQLDEVVGSPNQSEYLKLRLGAHLRYRFEQDRPMLNAEAYVLNLVDRIVGLTPSNASVW
jgi:ATP-dependent protease ClpP protease subunit